ncbi:MAG TPA: cellulase family glycosylhydrolase [Candidatus Dormibacteraeota bacterium]|nr:cellulase family glycosylhydrolase [Candidatus Dormibacteraeota bacterium]
MGTYVVARLVSAMCLLVVMAIVLAPAEQLRFVKGSSAAVRSGLHVKGTSLVDGSGKPVVLHGVNISGTEFACAQGGDSGNVGWSIFGGQPEDTPGTIAAMQKWHVNVVRVPLNEDCWLGLNGINPAYGGAAYRATIINFVQHLSSSGMYVIVDLHWNAPGNAVALSQQPMPDLDHSPAFWNSVARQFASELNVVFDLYNEPFLYGSYFESGRQDAWSCWLSGCALNQYLSGGQPYTKAQHWQAAGMQQLIDAVRSTGASNVVIANGLNWANDDSGWLAHRPHDPTGNLAAGWHEYGGEQCAAIACWAQTIAPIAQTVPVVVGETGDHTGSDCTLANLPTFLPWVDSHGISYLAWTFNPWGYNHDVLIKDWHGTPSACEGEYYAAHLAAVAANPPAIQSPQPVASPPRTTTAQPHPAGQVSEGGPRIYFAVLLIGVLSFIFGLALAMNFPRNIRRMIPRLTRSLQVRGSDIGILIAMCGAALTISSLFILLH